jgi:hypothetical protein
VDENIFAAIFWGDKAIPTTTIKTDYGTDCHGDTSRLLVMVTEIRIGDGPDVETDSAICVGFLRERELRDMRPIRIRN